MIVPLSLRSSRWVISLTGPIVAPVLHLDSRRYYLRGGATAKQVAMAGDRPRERAHVDDVAVDVDRPYVLPTRG